MTTSLEDLQDAARLWLKETAPAEGTPALAEERTPWMVRCSEHGPVYLTSDEYGRQLSRPDSLWTCPRCGEAAQWDDDNYESFYEEGP